MTITDTRAADAGPPERLWAWCFNRLELGGWSKWGGYARPDNRRPLDERERETGAEYVRADLVAEKDTNIAELRAEVERLRAALTDVIMTDHHNHYDWPPPRYVKIARAALSNEAAP